MKDNLISDLKLLYGTALINEFPSDDILKIEEDFQGDIAEIDWLTADFNEFCTLITGSCSYVFDNKKIPKRQREFLYRDFFSLYPKYLFLETAIEKSEDVNSC
jgi:hypothetical protein